jgi:hypothetical protein
MNGEGEIKEKREEDILTCLTRSPSKSPKKNPNNKKSDKDSRLMGIASKNRSSYSS